MKKIGVMLVVVLMLSLISLGVVVGADEDLYYKGSKSCPRDKQCPDGYGVRIIEKIHNL